ncbi:protein yellow [Anabrus simplex]|uniref:protein yellow n=1 Tax=Anabrus simplex TaxID=316456 RepID=UPI0035A31A3C
MGINTMHVNGLLVVLAVSQCVALRNLDVLYGWKSIDFKFPSRAARDSMLRSGVFVPGNSVPLDVDTWQVGKEVRTFITMPRLKPGTPATLATVSSDRSLSPTEPLLAPYPDWSWHRLNECDGLTSVFRIKVDTCGRLWVLDTGYVEILSNFRKVCPAQIVVFDLKTDKMVMRHRFPDNVIIAGSLPVTIAVDVRNTPTGCEEAFAYVADVTEYALVVFDAKNDRSWRIKSNYFYPYPPFGYFDIAGVQFDLMDGILGLALSPERPWDGGDRHLYFHSLASNRESWVSTAVIRNASLFEGDRNRVPRMFHVFEKPRASQAAAEDMDSNGIMFFSLLSRNSLNCWNAATPYGTENIAEVDRDDAALQFASGVKVIRNAQGQQEVWALTCRFQQLMQGDHDTSEVNYRVLRAPVQKLVRGTKCEPRSQQIQNPGGSGYGNQPFILRAGDPSSSGNL